MGKEGRTAIPRHMADHAPKNVVARSCHAVRLPCATFLAR